MKIGATKFWPYPTLFAHRGGGTLAPENTLAAMKVGHEHSFVAVEFDVKLSQDNVAILMHDATLDRTTDGRGLVAEQTMTQLETVDAGLWHGERFRGERIPRFSAIAKYLHALGMMANVEIKPCPGRENETGRIVAELCEELWRDRLVKPLISSFSVESLRAVRAAAPDLPIGLLVDDPNEKLLTVLEELGAVSLHCNHRHLTANAVRWLHRHDYRVMTYTVNDPASAAMLMELGVDGIFTDNLEIVAKQFPAQLHDTGSPMRDPADPDFIPTAIIPPIG